MQRRLITGEGFSLLECLISLFITGILVTAVLKHQIFLIKTQEQINDRTTTEIQKQNENLLQHFPHPGEWEFGFS